MDARTPARKAPTGSVGPMGVSVEPPPTAIRVLLPFEAGVPPLDGGPAVLALSVERGVRVSSLVRRSPAVGDGVGVAYPYPPPVWVMLGWCPCSIGVRVGVGVGAVVGVVVGDGLVGGVDIVVAVGVDVSVGVGVGVGVGEGSSRSDVGVGMVLAADPDDGGDADDSGSGDGAPRDVAPDCGAIRIGIDTTTSPVIPMAAPRIDGEATRLIPPSGGSLRQRVAHPHQ